MNILRRIVSFIVLVAAIAVLVGICMSYDWSDFGAVFSHFNFKNFAEQLSAFFDKAGNAIVLIMLGFIGLTMPGRKKKRI